MQQQINRFDFLRLLFACVVVFYHALALSGTVSIKLENLATLLVELSIQGFFIISGLLVYSSLVRSNNIYEYAKKRVRRLYPAYVVIIVIPAFASLLMGGELFPVLKYLVANLGFLNFLAPTLPGLFEELRFPQVNGALWTLKIEVMFYIILPLLAWAIDLLGRKKWVLFITIYIFAEIWRAMILLLDIPFAMQISRQLPGQMSFFVIGMSLWLLRDLLRVHITKTGVLGTILILLSFLPPLEFLRAIGLGGVIFFISYLPGPAINVARYGDLSYGVYITHFPIINLIIMAGFFANSVWEGLLMVTGLVAFASLLMWHVVEKPFLLRSSHYRKKN
ncbi:MAG: acyltransferase [Robiginitomaculum sp.]|nr:acyltransferase [Robiginitomaculum sp.]